MLLVLAAGIGLVVYGRHQTRKRRMEIQGVARRRGWRFTAEVKPVTWRRWGKFAFFKRGQNQKLCNLISGQIDGLDFKVFDYRYTTQGGNHSSTYHQTVAQVHSLEYAYPDFEMGPENIGHRFISLFGYQDIDFASSPVFSNQFLLRGKHVNRVRQLFSRRLRGDLESRSDWSIEGHGRSLLIFRHGHSCDAGEFADWIQEVIEITRYFQPD